MWDFSTGKSKITARIKLKGIAYLLIFWKVETSVKINNLPWHVGPLYSAGHEHSNPSSISVHVPPFLHGFGWHLFFSISYKNTKYNIQEKALFKIRCHYTKILMLITLKGLFCITTVIIIIIITIIIIIIIIIISTFITASAGVLYVRQPVANHAPRASVTQVSLSVQILSTFLRIPADPNMQIFWISVTLALLDTFSMFSIIPFFTVPSAPTTTGITTGITIVYYYYYYCYYYYSIINIIIIIIIIIIISTTINVRNKVWPWNSI